MMSIEKKKEMLDNLILSVKSKISDPNNIEIPTFKINDDDYFNFIDVNNKMCKMKRVSEEIRLTLVSDDVKSNTSGDLQYKFDIKINKVKEYFQFKNWLDDRSLYVTNIIIQNRNGAYYSWSKEGEFYFQEETIKEQKILFDILKDEFILQNKNKENLKYDKYIKEIAKMHSKDIKRDDRLSKILDI